MRAENMKGIVTLSVTLSLLMGLASGEAGSKDEQPKYAYSSVNYIGSTVKPDLVNYPQQYGNKLHQQQVVFPEHFQFRTQHLQQAAPYNHQTESSKKPLQHQPTPVAMVIIAQPAYVPVSLLQQGNVAQQLLQYFQGINPSTKYVASNHQYVPANHQPYYQQQQQQQQPVQARHQYVPQYQPQVEVHHYPSSTPAPRSEPQPVQTQFYSHEALPTPQALVAPQHHVVPHHLNLPNSQDSRTTSYQALEGQLDTHPQQLQQVDDSEDVQEPDFEKLAQQAAQHFLMNEGLNPGVKSSPAIITGLELFSPEQQEKIKAHLSAHFGSPLKPLQLAGGQNAHQQESSKKSYYDDYRRRLRTEKFVPSVQVKDGEIRQTSSAGGRM